MKNFGITDLRLTDPRDGWPNPLATSTAVHAADVVASARLFSSLADAISDMHYVYAATARPRFMNKGFVLTRELAADLPSYAGPESWGAADSSSGSSSDAKSSHISHSGSGGSGGGSGSGGRSGDGSGSGGSSRGGSNTGGSSSGASADSSVAGGRGAPAAAGAAAAPQPSGADPSAQPAHALGAAAAAPAVPADQVFRVGFVFGRESSGLTNDEVALANQILVVDANPGYPVLNLGQAVGVTTYELYQAHATGRIRLAGLALASGAAQAVVAGAAGAAAAAGAAGAAAAAGAAGAAAAVPGAAGAAQALGQAGGVVAAAAAVATGSGSGGGGGAAWGATAPPAATTGDVEGLLQRLFVELDGVGFFTAEHKRQSVQNSIRNLAVRVPRLSYSEVQLLHGMLSRLSAPPGRKRRRPDVQAAAGGDSSGVEGEAGLVLTGERQLAADSPS